MTENLPAPPPKRLRTTGNYTDAEIEHVLLTLARHSGSTTPAHRELRAAGWKIALTTLKNWREKYQERYLELQQQVIPTIRAQVAERQSQIVSQLADAEELALAETVAALPDLDGRDKANALRNISTSKGITLTHLQNYQAPPVDPNAAADTVADVFERLGKLGLLAKPVEAEAEEVSEAEVV